MLNNATCLSKLVGRFQIGRHHCMIVRVCVRCSGLPDIGAHVMHCRPTAYRLNAKLVYRKTGNQS